MLFGITLNRARRGDPVHTLKSRGSTALPLRRITTRPCSASATATRRIGCISGPH
jgi:hypothetical protein